MFSEVAHVIVFMGPPGSGKGTHAVPLSCHLGIPHISTGDLLRSEIREKTPLGRQAKAFIDQGNLVPDELIFHILFERVSQNDCLRGFILDGFPRTVSQAEIFEQKRDPSSLLSVINLRLNDDEVVLRIAGRLCCQGCNQLYHKLFSPPKHPRLCDCCLRELFQRDDDREEVVRKRLQVYHAQTAPLVHYYSEVRALKEVKASSSKEKVFSDILSCLPVMAG